jgi:hypothetical protein
MHPLTRSDLDAKGCDDPNCQHDHSILYLYPMCHVTSGTRVYYRERAWNADDYLHAL